MMQSVAFALVVPLGVAQVAQAAESSGLGRPDLPKPHAVHVEPYDGKSAAKTRRQITEQQQMIRQQIEQAKVERTAAWPGKGEATVSLTRGKAAKALPGGMPVTLSPPADAKAGAASGNARITVLDQKAASKAGITGVLLTAEADTAGATEVNVDYSRFASAVGGAWAQRLHLVQLPACALTTPGKPACRKQTPLASHNDARHQSVSAHVHLTEPTRGPSLHMLRSAPTTGATVLAVTAASAGSGPSPTGSGDFSATPLAASSAWQGGGSSGAFTWSYDFTVPPAAAGPTPSLALSYDSGSIDGRTATTNNQSSIVGEGFTLTESYIERTHVPCDDDGQTDVFDRCWKYDNARLVLNGKSARLVRVSGTDQEASVWRLENDDASTVTRSTGADNGDDNGEYWTVVTGDGTKYVFGLDKLDGATTQRTNSVWSVPVFGNNSGEPGYDNGSAFSGRALTQAWRWNLDYVEDTHGNASTYWYTKDKNYYKKNKATTADAEYIRGGYLGRIEYGLRKGALFTDKADAKVSLTYTERCDAADCTSLTKDTADNWPDVPFDAICSQGATDCNSAGPSFFIRKRLASIDTSSWNAATAAYDPVDSWVLGQAFQAGKDIDNSSDQVLTLNSLTRTGKAATTSISLKPITFVYDWRPNRVDSTADDILPFNRPRISSITSETGALTSVTLSSPECTTSEVSGAAADSNTRNCYPQYWHKNGAENASIDWFHKYRVQAVVVSDPAAGNPAVEYAYDYTGPAWHHNDDPFTPKDERTWSDWRGYRQVTAWTGATSLTRSKTVSLYMQGMHGDKNKDGTSKTVDVDPLLDTDVDFGSASDSDVWKGLLRQQVTYNGSQPITSVFKSYTYKQTASQPVPDASAHVARWVRTSTTYTSSYLTGSTTWRTRQTATQYDDLGMATAADDYGQRGLGGDESCTRTWYARNTTTGINSLVSRVRTVARSCNVTDASLNLPSSSDTAGDVLSDTATVYDTAGATGWSAAQKPTKGEVAWTGRATGYAATADANGDRLPSTWQTSATSTYDALGRPLSVTDTAGHTASTAYTPAAEGPLTKATTTNPKLFKSYVYFDPRRGLPLSSYDANLKLTTQTYDALGRLTQVWLPNRSSSSQSPNLKFDYHPGDSANASWVSTSTLKNDETYNTSYTLYDSLLRPLQTQTPTPLGGRLLTDTHYDTRGLPWDTSADVFDTTKTPNGTYNPVPSGAAPDQTQTVYDGAARPTTTTLYVGGVKKWATTTSYTGDSVATTALQGGSAQRTITDIFGRTTETRSYAGTSPADTGFGTGPGASYTSTKFTYTVDGKQKTITGPDGATWSYGYDLFGRQTSATDPDKGTTTTAYTPLDQVFKTTNANDTVLTAYDELGRVTGTWSGSQTDANQLTDSTYDTVLKGLPASSTRYVGGKNGAAYKQSVTAYDELNRPTTTQLQLPATDAFVRAGNPPTLEFGTTYNTDGTVRLTKEPALGGLPSESIDYKYDGLGNLTSIGGATGYLRNVSYSELTQPRQLTLGTGASGSKDIYVANTFEAGTGRLTRSYVQDQTHTFRLQDLNYTYDQAGDVTQISDTSTAGAETQCFAYDGYQRLTEAWTPASQQCTDTRSASALGGPAPYWTSYAYNPAGQRTSETTHKSTGDTKTTYCYTKTSQPHTLTGTTTKGDCAAPERTYAYDTKGNTTQRPGQTAGVNQTLAWSPEGKLTKLTQSGTSTEYIYDATGNLLIRSTQNGERVLYAGATELHLRANDTTWAQRYYTAGGITAAFRSNQSGTNKLTYLAGDHHGTSTLALTPDTAQSYTKRYTTPFGADRGQPLNGPWPNDKGFLGMTRDVTTGLTHIGAREYDPNIGQFISVDPLLEADKHQTLNGYSYAAQNPLTYSDPSGMGLACGGNGDDIPCPTRPDGSPGNGRPNEGVDYSKPHTPHPCNSNCDTETPRAEDGQPLLAGVRIPTEKELRALPWSHESYDYNLMTWADDQCRMDIASEVCAAAHALGWIRPKGDILEVLGVRDAVRCWNGSASACVWTAIGFIPLGKVGKAASLLRAGEKEATVAAKVGATCFAHSFVPGTDVLLADGTHKNIEEIQVGDKVLATDPDTGKTTTREVIDTIVTDDDKDFVDLTIATGQDESSDGIIATTTHPFWSPSEESWVTAGDLRVDMTLRTDKGATVKITAVQQFTKRQRTHDLTIADIHTYYVLAGATPVLVHNSNCQFWSRTDYNGQRIYQRDDLVNPDYVSPADKYGRTNLKRMQQGLAPMGPDNKPLNLHHMLQTQDGPIAEVTHSMHFGNYNQLHWKAGTKIPSGIDRDAFNAWKSQYWKDRAAGFGG